MYPYIVFADAYTQTSSMRVAYLHELAHVRQVRRSPCGPVGFYLAYFFELVWQLVLSRGDLSVAYRSLSYELEAYTVQDDPESAAPAEWAELGVDPQRMNHRRGRRARAASAAEKRPLHSRSDMAPRKPGSRSRRQQGH